MTSQYEQRLIELVNELFEDSRYLLTTESSKSICLASDISYLKGYVDVLKEEKLK